MKPPHSGRPGGSSRPPSDRGPSRGPGGPSSRPPGGGSGPRSEYRGAGPRGSASADGPREYQKPRSQAAPYGGPKSGPRTGSRDGAPGGGGFKPRPSRDDQAPRSGAPAYRPRDSDAPRPVRTRDSDAPRPAASRPVRTRDSDAPRPVRTRDSDAPRPARSRDAEAPHPARSREYDTPRATPDSPKRTVWLYGHHAISAALANPARRLRRLLLTDEAEAAISKHLPPPWAVSPERVDRARLDLLLGKDVVHQGAALLADPLAPPSLQSVLEKPGVIIVLDQVTDPRNVGAIMRSAAAFGAACVITQDRNGPEETGGLAKAASGALEKMPLLRAVNIARTIIALKAANVWCIGLDAGGKPLSGPAFSGRRVALVLGAEGEGLRRLTKETCDEVAGLAIDGAMESLNVSAAASVALYELTRR